MWIAIGGVIINKITRRWRQKNNICWIYFILFFTILLFYYFTILLFYYFTSFFLIISSWRSS
jgi:hypothetical protein